MKLVFCAVYFLCVCGDVLAASKLIKGHPIYAEIVVDVKNNKILHCFNVDQATQPASLTKMMTLYIVFSRIASKQLELTDRVFFSKNAIDQKPSKLDVKLNDSISIREAIQALTVKSANDVAVALAEKIAGSEEKFVGLMNFYAKELKMYSTVFKTASGWKNKKQLTTARDMAKLTIALRRDFPSFLSFFEMKNFEYNNTVIKNHNNILGYHENLNFTVDGMKTGYVSASGFNLAASAKDKFGRRIIAVILGGPTAKWRDCRMLYLLDCAFSGELPKPSNVDTFYKKQDEKNTKAKKNRPCIIKKKKNIKTKKLNKIRKFESKQFKIRKILKECGE